MYAGWFSPFLHTYGFSSRKNAADKAAAVSLLLAEGHAVGALIHGGIALMGAHQDSIQGAVVGAVTVMGALLDSTLNALVCVAVHSIILLFR